MRSFAILALSAVAASVSFCRADDRREAAKTAGGPTGGVPELEVLNRYAGTWDVEMTVKPTAGLPNGLQSKGVVTAKWVVGGRFLEQSGKLEPGPGTPAMHATTLMTYDPARRAYRSWMFLSSGHVSEGAGTWDAQTRTMTTTAGNAEAGLTTTTTATFNPDGTETWRMVVRDRAGAVVEESSGKNTPRKKAAK